MKKARAKAANVTKVATADDLRPPGTVQVPCSTPHCRWEFWVDALHPLLPNGPFFCDGCSEGATYEFSAQVRGPAEEVYAGKDSPGVLFALEFLHGREVRVTVEVLTAQTEVPTVAKGSS